MKKIAIVRRNGLGDLLCAYPLVLYLRSLYPQAKITLFLDAKNANLLPYFPFPEKAVIFPSRGNKYLHLFRYALTYRKEKFDLAISAKTSPMKMISFFLKILGASKSLQPQKKISSLHQALKTLQIFDPTLNDVKREFYPRLRVPLESKKKYPHHFSHPLLLLCATTTNSKSRLSPARYAATANTVGFFVLLIGEEKDRTRVFAIAEGLKVPYQIHFPRNFEEFMVLLDAADLYFVGDGGVAHIGAALGKHEVVFFGETSPDIWGPLSEKATTLYHPSHVNDLQDEKIVEVLQAKAKEVLHHLGKLLM